MLPLSCKASPSYIVPPYPLLCFNLKAALLGASQPRGLRRTDRSVPAAAIQIMRCITNTLYPFQRQATPCRHSMHFITQSFPPAKAWSTNRSVITTDARTHKPAGRRAHQQKKASMCYNTSNNRSLLFTRESNISAHIELVQRPLQNMQLPLRNAHTLYNSNQCKKPIPTTALVDWAVISNLTCKRHAAATAGGRGARTCTQNQADTYSETEQKNTDSASSRHILHSLMRV
jgi:hypothetical protein